jgi:hypothetical protein
MVSYWVVTAGSFWPTKPINKKRERERERERERKEIMQSKQ